MCIQRSWGRCTYNQHWIQSLNPLPLGEPLFCGATTTTTEVIDFLAVSILRLLWQMHNISEHNLIKIFVPLSVFLLCLPWELGWSLSMGCGTALGSVQYLLHKVCPHTLLAFPLVKWETIPAQGWRNTVGEKKAEQALLMGLDNAIAFFILGRQERESDGMREVGKKKPLFSSSKT